MTRKPTGNLGRILLVVGRVMLGVVFLYAAYAKLKPQVPGMAWSAASVKTSLLMFAMQVDSYQMLPPTAVSRAAHLLPFFELALGLWLVSGVALRFSSLVTTLLLGGFFGVMLRTYALGLEISCGCFGPGEKLGTKTLLRDGTLLALSIAVTVGAFLLRRGKSQSPAAQPAPQRAE
jgi:uncharacterized membrane protein YphA (DoxX/SURF4 family)